MSKIQHKNKPVNISSDKDPKHKKPKRQKILTEHDKIKKHYFKMFYYAFSISFIVFGLIAVIFFVYKQDKNFFGFTERYYNKAVTYYEEENYEKAEKQLVSCIKSDPEYTEARLLLTDIYVKDGKYDLALKLLNESISLHKRNEKFYLKYITTLTKQNKISEALEFISSIKDRYITVKIAEFRPKNIISQLDPGTYDAPQQANFTIHEGCKIYYTLDGTPPNTGSSEYTGTPIDISKGTVNLRAFAINEDGYISDEYKSTYRIYNKNTAYVFKDTKVEQIVRKMIGKDKGTILFGDLEGIKKFTSDASDTSVSGNISTLEDLGAFANLVEVEIKGEKNISSFEALSTLKSVNSVQISNCGLTDAQVAQYIAPLIWLESLNLDGNDITSLNALSALPKLKTLSAKSNSIRSAAGINLMSNLTNLDLSQNLISDISGISSDTKLKTLNLSNNLITSVTPLASLTLLSDLSLANNKIERIDDIQRLTQLRSLDLSNNQSISSIAAIAPYTSLITIDISNTAVSDISALSKIKTLTTLNASATKVQDFSAIASLQIKNLSAAKNSLTDGNLSAISAISTIETLDISQNKIQDVSSIKKLAKLKVLDISGNEVENISQLVNCSSLNTVNCSNTPATANDISNLKKYNINVIKD